MSFTLYPAIDLKEGQAVRLLQGRMADATVYDPNPANAARRWVEAGARFLHVVDLDGAFAGAPQNWDALQAILGVALPAGVRVQLGGGIRTEETVARALDLGISRVIIGTRALEGDFVAQLVAAFGSERIVVGIDARSGMVATRGWADQSDVKATDLAVRMREAGVRTTIYTDISRDGMMTGPNFSEMEAMAATGLEVIASGGVSSLADIRRLMEIRSVTGAILGKALYTGAVDLKEALALCR